MLADRRVWRGVTSALGAQVCVELPGHGRAPAWDGGDYQAQALGLLEAEIGVPVHLVGHSFGATVALRFAVEHPELLTRLTLIEPVFFHAAQRLRPAEFGSYQQRAAPMAKALGRNDLTRAAEQFLGMWGVPGAWTKLPDDARVAIAAKMPLIDVSAASLVDDTGHIWPRLGRIDCPVRLVTGGRSEPVMAAVADALGDALNLEAQVIADAGHMIPLTHGAELGRLLAASP